MSCIYPYLMVSANIAIERESLRADYLVSTVYADLRPNLTLQCEDLVQGPVLQKLAELFLKLLWCGNIERLRHESQITRRISRQLTLVYRSDAEAKKERYEGGSESRARNQALTR